jgi:hypothetical protein
LPVRRCPGIAVWRAEAKEASHKKPNLKESELPHVEEAVFKIALEKYGLWSSQSSQPTSQRWNFRVIRESEPLWLPHNLQTIMVKYRLSIRATQAVKIPTIAIAKSNEGV